MDLAELGDVLHFQDRDDGGVLHDGDNTGTWASLSLALVDAFDAGPEDLRDEGSASRRQCEDGVEAPADLVHGIVFPANGPAGFRVDEIEGRVDVFGDGDAWNSAIFLPARLSGAIARREILPWKYGRSPDRQFSGRHGVQIS